MVRSYPTRKVIYYTAANAKALTQFSICTNKKYRPRNPLIDTNNLILQSHEFINKEKDNTLSKPKHPRLDKQNKLDLETAKRIFSNSQMYKSARSIQRTKFFSTGTKLISNVNKIGLLEKTFKSPMEQEISIFDPSKTFTNFSEESRYFKIQKMLSMLKQNLEAFPEKQKQLATAALMSPLMKSYMHTSNIGINRVEEFIEFVINEDFLHSSFASTLYNIKNENIGMRDLYESEKIINIKRLSLKDQTNENPIISYSKTPTNKPFLLPQMHRQNRKAQSILSKYIDDHIMFNSKEYRIPSIGRSSVHESTPNSHKEAPERRKVPIRVPEDETSMMKKNKLLLEKVMLERAKNKEYRKPSKAGM